jgi:hypothetical protein
MAQVTFLRVSGVVLAVTIGLGPIVPPEHVHETEEHGHHRMVVHRHAEAHGLSVPAAPHHREVHEDDDPVLTLTPLFTVPGVPAVPPASTATVVVLPEPPVPVAFHRAGDSNEPLIHGPPRAPAPQRGPPRFSRL